MVDNLIKKRENIDLLVATLLQDVNHYFLFPSIMAAIDLVEEHRRELFKNKSEATYAAAFIICCSDEFKRMEISSAVQIKAEDVLAILAIREETLPILAFSDELLGLLKKYKFDFKKEFHDGCTEITALEAEEFDESFYEDDIVVYEFQFLDAKKEHRRRELFNAMHSAVVELQREGEEDTRSEIRIVSEFEEGRTYNILVRCTYGDDYDIMEMCEVFEEYDYNIREIQSDRNLYTPVLSFVSEMIMSEREVYEIENSELDALFSGCSDYIQVYENYFLNKEFAVAASEKLIQESPHLMESYIIKAGWSLDHIERLDLLEKAIEIGNNNLNFELLKKEESMWFDYNARPLLRAKLIYANELLRYDFSEDAEELLEELIENDPFDHLFARLILSQHYIWNKKWRKFLNLRSRFKNEDLPVFLYGEFVRNYYVLGRKSKTKRSLYDAYDEFPFPIYHIFNIEEDEYEFVEEWMEEMNDFLFRFFMKVTTNDSKFLQTLIGYMYDHPDFKELLEDSLRSTNFSLN